MEGDEVEMMKIRVFDDEKNFSKMLKTEIEEVGLPKDKFDIGVVSEEEFLSAMEGLSKRRELYRKEGVWERTGANLFDDVFILLVDFDLFELQDNHNFKADTIAYLVRSFSTCGIIIRVNRFGHNPFDLTLKGDLSSFADFDLGVEQLRNLSLWGMSTNDGFSPWYWPNLPKFASDFEKRANDVENAIKSRITIRSVLGFSDEAWKRLPRVIAQFFGSSEENMQFDDFLVNSQSGLEFKDGKNLMSEKVNVDWSIFSRLAAARVSKWLEYAVLKEQDILVDAPHLVSRFPSLIKERKNDINAWNGLCVRDTDLVPNLDTNIIEPFRLKNKHWISRPVWFWQGVLNCKDIADVKEPWNIEAPGWVFCEDASAFYKEDECREFKAESISPFTGRYIKNFDRVEYFPPERFAL